MTTGEAPEREELRCVGGERVRLADLQAELEIRRGKPLGVVEAGGHRRLERLVDADGPAHARRADLGGERAQLRQTLRGGIGSAVSIATVYAATWVLNSSSGSADARAAATARAATSARSADDPGAHNA